ncbi:MAG: alpha/beta hydrolase [Bacillota bacterium]|nr:alpha/beta hydrolase [Bacillota bacterium]
MKSYRVPLWSTEALVLEEGNPGDPAVLFLHGLGSGARAWEELMPPLARKGFRCLAIDLPGMGDTPPPKDLPFPYPGPHLEAFLAQLWDALHLRHLRGVVGWSLGGGIALHMGRLYPHHVEKLVLAAPAGLGREVAWGLRLIGLPGLGQRFLRTPIPQLPEGDMIFLPKELALQPVPRAFVERHLEMMNHPWYGETQLQIMRESRVLWQGQKTISQDVDPGSLAQPVLLFWGREDAILPSYQGERAIKKLKRGVLHILSPCGHCLPVEFPNVFLRETAAFLKG